MNQMNMPIFTIPDTLQDVVERLQLNKALSDTKRRDLVSDVRSAARLIGRHPREISTDVPSLRTALREVRPKVHNISEGRFRNVKSNLARALRFVRVLPRPRSKPQMTDAWSEYWSIVGPKHLQVRLSKFVTFCLHREIEPRDVNEDAFRDFQEVLDKTSIYKLPKKVSDDAARAWNRINECNRLQLATLTVSKTGRYVTPRLDTYPDSFQQDLEKYKARLRCRDIFTDEGPDKPLRESSITTIESDVRQVLGAAVQAGVTQDEFKSLADLVDENHIEMAFDWLASRNEGRPTTGMRNMAATLVNIAKHFVKVEEKQLCRLKVMRKKVTVHQEGMSEKNRLRLKQFDDWKNTGALLTLPDKLMARAKRHPSKFHSPTDALYATAISILLSCPMRMKNLAELDVEKNIIVSGKGSRRRFKLWVPGEDVKNGVAIDVDLMLETSAVLAAYLDRFRPELVDVPTSALFPSQRGGNRPASSLGYGITNIIRNETGLDVHPHLFRHLTAKLYLQEYHGDYESVRRQLGHKKYDTTLKFYAVFDNRAAQQRYHGVLLNARGPK